MSVISKIGNTARTTATSVRTSVASGVNSVRNNITEGFQKPGMSLVWWIVKWIIYIGLIVGLIVFIYKKWSCFPLLFNKKRYDKSGLCFTGAVTETQAEHCSWGGETNPCCQDYCMIKPTKGEKIWGTIEDLGIMGGSIGAGAELGGLKGAALGAAGGAELTQIIPNIGNMVCAGPKNYSGMQSLMPTATKKGFFSWFKGDRPDVLDNGNHYCFTDDYPFNADQCNGRGEICCPGFMMFSGDEALREMENIHSVGDFFKGVKDTIESTAPVNTKEGGLKRKCMKVPGLVKKSVPLSQVPPEVTDLFNKSAPSPHTSSTSKVSEFDKLKSDLDKYTKMSADEATTFLKKMNKNNEPPPQTKSNEEMVDRWCFDGYDDKGNKDFKFEDVWRVHTGYVDPNTGYLISTEETPCCPGTVFYQPGSVWYYLKIIAQGLGGALIDAGIWGIIGTIAAGLGTAVLMGALLVVPGIGEALDAGIAAAEFAAEGASAAAEAAGIGGEAAAETAVEGATEAATEEGAEATTEATVEGGAKGGEDTAQAGKSFRQMRKTMKTVDKLKMMGSSAASAMLPGFIGGGVYGLIVGFKAGIHKGETDQCLQAGPNDERVKLGLKADTDLQTWNLNESCFEAGTIGNGGKYGAMATNYGSTNYPCCGGLYMPSDSKGNECKQVPGLVEQNGIYCFESGDITNSKWERFATNGQNLNNGTQGPCCKGNTFWKRGKTRDDQCVPNIELTNFDEKNKCWKKGLIPDTDYLKELAPDKDGVQGYCCPGLEYKFHISGSDECVQPDKDNTVNCVKTYTKDACKNIGEYCYNGKIPMGDGHHVRDGDSNYPKCCPGLSYKPCGGECHWYSGLTHDTCG